MRARICQVVLDVLPRDRKQSVQCPQPSQAGQEEEVVVGVGVIPSCVQRVRQVSRAAVGLYASYHGSGSETTHCHVE